MVGRQKRCLKEKENNCLTSSRLIAFDTGLSSPYSSHAKRSLIYFSRGTNETSVVFDVRAILLDRFPFYYWIKIGIVLWMMSPAGSTLLYKRFVQPALKEREQVSSAHRCASPPSSRFDDRLGHRSAARTNQTEGLLHTAGSDEQRHALCVQHVSDHGRVGTHHRMDFISQRDE